MKTTMTLLLLAVAVSIGSLVQAQQSQIELDFDIQEISPQNAADTATLWFQEAVDLEGVQPSSHWMGVVVRPTDPLIRKHLQIDGGLIVQQVTEGSPAAEAGIQADDILLAGNDTPVAEFKGLMEFLTKNEGNELTLWYLREGKKRSVEVKPTKRPESHEKSFTQPKIEGALGRFDLRGKTPEEVRKWVEEMAKTENAGQALKIDGENPLKIRFFHPGVILGEDVRIQPAHPRVQTHAIQIDGGLNGKLNEINSRLEKIEKALQKLAD